VITRVQWITYYVFDWKLSFPLQLFLIGKFHFEFILILGRTLFRKKDVIGRFFNFIHGLFFLRFSDVNILVPYGLNTILKWIEYVLQTLHSKTKFDTQKWNIIRNFNLIWRMFFPYRGLSSEFFHWWFLPRYLLKICGKSYDSFEKVSSVSWTPRQ